MRALRFAALSTAVLLSLSQVAAAQAPPAAQVAPAGTTIDGKIVRVAPTYDSFIVQTADGRQVTLYPSDKTVYRRGTQTFAVRDLRPNTPVSVAYDVRDNRNIVNSVNWVEKLPPPAAAAAPAQPAPAGAGTTIQGTLVRVEGTDQFIVRTADGKEMILYGQPQTVYKVDNRPVQVTELVPNTPVTVVYDVRERRPIVRSLIGGPRR